MSFVSSYLLTGKIHCYMTGLGMRFRMKFVVWREEGIAPPTGLKLLAVTTHGGCGLGSQLAQNELEVILVGEDHQRSSWSWLSRVQNEARQRPADVRVVVSQWGWGGRRCGHREVQGWW